MAWIRIPANRKTQLLWGEPREHPELQGNIPGCPSVVGKDRQRSGGACSTAHIQGFPWKAEWGWAQLRKELAELGAAGRGAIRETGVWKEKSELSALEVGRCWREAGATWDCRAGAVQVSCFGIY